MTSMQIEIEETRELLNELGYYMLNDFLCDNAADEVKWRDSSVMILTRILIKNEERRALIA